MRVVLLNGFSQNTPGFRYQTKPKLSTHGDLYYEGKEQETRMKEKKPGDISDDLRSALGMPVIEVIGLVNITIRMFCNNLMFLCFSFFFLIFLISSGSSTG